MMLRGDQSLYEVITIAQKLLLADTIVYVKFSHRRRSWFRHVEDFERLARLEKRRKSF